MTADEFLRTILDPGVAWCASLPGWNIPFDDRAKVLMLAIAGQESGWTERVQSGNGPAHGFWQFERGGGVSGVLTNPATAELAGEACRMMYVAPGAAQAWNVMATERGDNLAVAFARLLLWSDPAPLPAARSPEAAWQYYLRLWRPGKPRPNDWPANYEAADYALVPPGLRGAVA